MAMLKLECGTQHKWYVEVGQIGTHEQVKLELASTQS